jgi:hypothetical protein
MRRRTIAVLAAGGILLLVGVVVSLSDRQYRVLNSNLVANGQFIAEVPPGGAACQDGEFLMAGTGRIGVTIANRGRPTDPVVHRFIAGGKTVAQARMDRGWTEGPVAVPLDRIVAADTPDVRWCVRNRGRAPVLVAGQPGFDYSPAVVDGEAVGARMRVEYLTPDRRSWWSELGTVADRFAFGRARHFSGAWVLWIAGVLVLAGWVVAVRLVLRLSGPEP